MKSAMGTCIYNWIFLGINSRVVLLLICTAFLLPASQGSDCPHPHPTRLHITSLLETLILLEPQCPHLIGCRAGSREQSR